VTTRGSYARSPGAMLVAARASADAKARIGQQSTHELSGPLVFVLVFAAALIFFAMANATAIESLLAQQELNSRQWIRLIVSASLCGGLVFIMMRKLNEVAERSLDPTSPDPS